MYTPCILSSCEVVEVALAAAVTCSIPETVICMIQTKRNFFLDGVDKETENMQDWATTLRK